MKGKTKPMALLLLSILAPTAIGIGVFCWANSALAETAPHIIINEIQTAGISDKNEFVELFNPTNEPISLDGFKLSKKTKTGSESALLSPSKFSGTIEARGYFLIANPTYRDDILADLSFSGSSYYISNDNTVLLYDKNGALLDKAGFGSASDFETAPAPNPDSNQSIERTDFIDTGNNAVDFSINISPSPKNSSITEGNDEESQSDVENIDDDSQDTPGACAALSSNIKLNEIFPYPSAGEEFIELYNPNGFCVDLSDWALFDENLEKTAGQAKK